MNHDIKEETQQMPEALQKKQERLDKQEEQLDSQQKNIKKIKRKNTLLTVGNTLLTAVFVAVCLFSIYRRYDETVIYEKPAPIDENQTKTTEDNSKKIDENQQKTFDLSRLERDEYGFYIYIDENGNRILLDKNGNPVPVDENGVPIIYDENGERIPTDENGKLLLLDKDGNRIPISDIWKYVSVAEDGKAKYIPKTENASENSTAENSAPVENQGENHFTIYSVGDVYTAENGRGELHCDVRNTEDSTHDIVMSIYLTEEELKKHNLKTDGVEGGQWLIAQTGLFEPGYQISSVQLLALPDGSYLPAGTYSAIMNEKYYHHETGVLSSYEANIPVTLEVAN